MPGSTLLVVGGIALLLLNGTTLLFMDRWYPVAALFGALALVLGVGQKVFWAFASPERKEAEFDRYRDRLVEAAIRAIEDPDKLYAIESALDYCRALPEAKKLEVISRVAEYGETTATDAGPVLSRIRKRLEVG